MLCLQNIKDPSAARPLMNEKEAPIPQGGSSEYNEADLHKLLSNLAQQPQVLPDVASVTDSSRLAVRKLISSLSILKPDAEQWNSKLKESVHQLVNEPSLVAALHAIASNAGVVVVKDNHHKQVVMDAAGQHDIAQQLHLINDPNNNQLYDKKLMQPVGNAQASKDVDGEHLHKAVADNVAVGA